MKGGCGFPMVPFALFDLVGLDTSLAILEVLLAEWAEPDSPPCAAPAAHGRGRETREEIGTRILRLPSLATTKEVDGERAKPWVMRTYSGHSSADASRTAVPQRTSPRARPACRSRSTCRPKRAMTRTTRRPRGEVGKVGVPIAHLGHMQASASRGCRWLR